MPILTFGFLLCLVSQLMSAHGRPPLVFIAVDGLHQGIYPYTDPIDFFIGNSTFISINCSIPVHPYATLYSYATGLEPVYHGILAGHMYDRYLRRHFNVTGNDDPVLWLSNDRIRPIWSKVQESGRNVACIGYPGCCSFKKGITKPSHCTNELERNSIEERFEDVLEQIDEGRDFIMTFINEPGKIMRRYGLKSEEAKRVTKRLNNAFSNFERNLLASNNYGKVNIILTSTQKIADRKSFLEPHTVDPKYKDGLIFVGDEGQSIQIFNKNHLENVGNLINAAYRFPVDVKNSRLDFRPGALSCSRFPEIFLTGSSTGDELFLDEDERKQYPSQAYNRNPTSQHSLNGFLAINTPLEARSAYLREAYDGTFNSTEVYLLLEHYFDIAFEPTALADVLLYDEVKFS